MKKSSMLFIFIFAIVAFATWPPTAQAKPEFYTSKACFACHGGAVDNKLPGTGTCAGCHAHAVFTGNAKGSINITATPDKNVYAPGDSVMVTINGGTGDGGWIRAKLFNKDCSKVACDTNVTGLDVIDFGSNPCPSCPPISGVGGLDGVTTHYPVILIGTAPDTPGTVTWSASWYGYDPGTTAGRPLWTPDPGNGGHGDDIVTFTFEVAPPNTKPVANDDAFTTPQDTTLSVSAPGVLGNDSDVDGDSLTAGLLTNPASGTLTLNPDGSFSYMPTAGFFGLDTFTYAANDGALDSNVATVTITVSKAVNNPPVAINDTVTTDEGTPVTIDVLANDNDPDGNAITVTTVGTPTSGTAVINADSTITYTPNANFNGSDGFAYTISDGELTATATVSVTTSSPSGDLRITVARWEASKSNLKVRGLGPVGAEVSITDANTGNSLGTAEVDERGKWKLDVVLNPKPVPCSVRAAIGLQFTEKVVKNAPAYCDDGVPQSVTLRITLARWEASKTKLKVRGRGPIGAEVVITDADTGDPLGTAEVDERGRWKLVVFELTSVPCRVRAAIGEQSAEKAVRDAPAGCDDNDDNDYDNEDNEDDKDDDN